MIPMIARAIAGMLVLVLVGPSVVSATCELTCVMARHHHSAPTPAEASCHEHQGTTQDIGIGANPSPLCHESGALPSAIVDAWLAAAVLPAAPPATVVVAPAVTTTSIVRAPDRRTLFAPPPIHRPLRV